MMNKVLLVGELISNKVVAKNSQGTVNAFIIATVRVPKDSRREKEVHFIYCKAFGKNVPAILEQANIGDILSVSGQLATTSLTQHDGSKDYRMEVWVESIKHIPEKIRNSADISNPSHLIEQAVSHYSILETLGEQYVHTIPVTKDSQSIEKEAHIEILKNVVEEVTSEVAENDSKEKVLA